MEPDSFAPLPVSLGRMHPLEAATVTRALGCPDLFLLDCSEAAPRERMILNVVRAAAERGERCLIISPDPAAADRLVEALASDRTLRAVRALADDENPMRPSPAVSRMTSSGAGANRAELLRRDAMQTVARLEGTLASLERSRDFHEKLDALERERQSVLEQLNRTDVESPRSPMEIPSRCREIQVEREVIRARRAELERAPASKSGIIARLFGFGKPAATADHSTELKQLAERDAVLVAECEASTRRQAEDVEKRLTDEVASRRATLSQRIRELESESSRVDSALRELHPQAASEDTVENGTPSRATRLELERELAVARTCQQELSEAGPELGRRLLGETQIVVGTPGCIACDPVFVVLNIASNPFDHLILDHGEELNEVAFERLSPLASKWILAGDAAPPPPPISNGRPPRGRAAEPTLLARLARLIDREPWRIDGDQLIVRLVHLAEKQRIGLVREPLLDHPDVELGVVNLNGEPVLAEIAFPATTAIPAAKSFLVSQLGEVVLRTCGEPEWRSTEDTTTATWPLFDNCDGEWIELEPGLRERIATRDTTSFTAAVAFDSASWDESAAKEWLASRAFASASRLAVLPGERPARHPIYAR